MKIGVTETYDPCNCIPDWIDRFDEFNFVTFITKNLSDQFIDLVCHDTNWRYDKKPSIIHLTCTGWGGTWLEPNVPTLTEYINQITKLLDNGFPKNRLVIRIDPMIPTVEGVWNAANVFYSLEYFKIKRYRVSILDMYRHVAERFKSDKNGDLILDSYSITNTGYYRLHDKWFYTYNELMKKLIQSNQDITIEACAENRLTQCTQLGCVSTKDLEINNINFIPPKGNQRYNCLCLQKSQLIPGGMSRGRCPNKCVYCYLKDKL